MSRTICPHWRWLLLLAALVPAALPLAGQEAQGRKYALLVGVRKYDPNQLRSLAYAEDDVTALAQLLRGAGYSRTVLLTQTAGAEDARFLPLAGNVRKTLKSLLEDRRPEDTILIAFAGHGVQFRGSDEAFFCPMDARLTDRNTLISLAEVYRALKDCPAHSKLLLVDACRNDPQSDHARSLAEVKLESVTRPQVRRPPGGVAALFSCAAGEKAYESPALKHGVFFHYVLEGLRGKAANARGLVTLNALAEYVQAEVRDKVKDEFGEDYVQRPQLVGELTGSVALLSVSNTQAAKPLSRPTAALIFQDSFDGPTPLAVPLFDERVMSFRHVKGAGRLTSTSPGIVPAMYHQPRMRDFIAELDFRAPTPGAGSGYGLIFRSADIVNGGLASYYILLVEPGKKTATLMCWQAPRWALTKSYPLPAGLVSAERANRMRLEVAGSEFRVFVNETFVGALTDRTLQGPGILGLSVNADSAKADTVEFSRLRVFAPR